MARPQASLALRGVAARIRQGFRVLPCINTRAQNSLDAVVDIALDSGGLYVRDARAHGQIGQGSEAAQVVDVFPRKGTVLPVNQQEVSPARPISSTRTADGNAS